MFFGGSAALAQDATPAAGEAHPIVGSWLLDTDTANPDNPMTLAVFTSDGVYFQVEPGEGGTHVGAGSWQSTGATTADMTFWIFEADGAMLLIRASIDSPDPQSVTATYTIEFIEPDGTSSGEIGPGMAEGTRISVEPQGTPVGSFEDVFAPEEATPAD
jgi:hypothetical protein